MDYPNPVDLIPIIRCFDASFAITYYALFVAEGPGPCYRPCIYGPLIHLHSFFPFPRVGNPRATNLPRFFTMRTTLYTVLVVLTALVPVFAIPGITPDLTARDDDHFHPKPSGVYHKREPHPSPKPGQQYKKRAEQEALTHSDDFSRDLCPLGMTACPITAAPGHTCSAPTSLLEWIREGYECTDVRMDLNSCGGCGSVDLG